MVRNWLIAWIFAWLAAIFASAAPAKDIGILVDRSMSVEPANRTEAMSLIGGLLTGSIPEAAANRWHFIPERADGNDPLLEKLHTNESSRIDAILRGASMEGLATGPHQLFLGDFGDLATVAGLRNTAWKGVDAPSIDALRDWSNSLSSSDKETHLELARAITANLMLKKEAFYLFVVSDGVEDLVNWPVSSYLDEAKCGDLEFLSRGDFRDSAKQRILERLNLQRRQGQDVTIGGRSSVGYGAAERSEIDRYRSSFSEKFLGRISLTAPHLKSFFTENRGKVPVSILVYSANVKSAAEVRFTSPTNSSLDNPEPITLRSATISWEETWRLGAQEPGGEATLSIHQPGNSKPIFSKPVEPSGTMDLLKTFPDLPEGVLEVRLTRTFAPHSQPEIQRSAHVIWRRGAPILSFAGDWVDCNAPAQAYVFDPRRDRDILGTRFTWEFRAQEPGTEIEPPAELTRILSLYDAANVGDGPQLVSESRLKPLTKSKTLAELLRPEVGTDSEDIEPLPLGGLYRLQISGRWEDGAKATADAWFQLPQPRLTILGQESSGSSLESARKVTKGDSIKIGNWMHDWSDFDYELIVWKDKAELPFNLTPLQLEKSGGETLIKIMENPDAPLRFEVLFGPRDPNVRNSVSLITASGYVEPAKAPILPWVLGTFAIVTFGLFAWNFASRR